MNKLSIVIIDYGVGNTHSVSNAIKFLNYKNVVISRDIDIIRNADVLILPGVGAFDEAFGNLRGYNLDTLLQEVVIEKRKPILGICVGMQMLCEGSEENGWHSGLGWIPGKVIKLNLPNGYAIPHVGWNNLSFNPNIPIFERLNESPNFYFDHSFHFNCENPRHEIAHCDYGIKITAAVKMDNITGVQFHPEKSQISGLKFLRGYFNSL